jgi:very-short-patch-repair endonuclease
MGTVSITIEGYLVQAKLEDALRKIVGNDCWRGREIRLPVGRRRWDMSYEIDGKVTVVEFDGDEHYRNTLKIKIDEEKDQVATELGFRVVRIPYWVQLTKATLRHYFNLTAEIKQDFPHGFITTKVFPASFCELGVTRFERELISLPVEVRDAVITSLRDRCKEHGNVYVLPSRLRDKL